MKLTSSFPKMLVVDDDKIIRMVSQRVYGSTFDLNLAQDGLEALSLLKKQNIEIILTDISMPLLDGISLTRAIRQLNNQNQHALVIGITANNDEDLHKEAKRAGMNAVFAKPVKPEEVLSVIHNHYHHC